MTSKRTSAALQSSGAIMSRSVHDVVSTHSLARDAGSSTGTTVAPWVRSAPIVVKRARVESWKLTRTTSTPASAQTAAMEGPRPRRARSRRERP
ncbi:hypothetical protein [Clavibacter michiganensis]|uniref:hypothetical protein n=1 Tax=Clavibacter michiganensis TaxID=28447 RepID=UPI0013659234|nr:hypothetical protein [Clavibacter michiganensis]QIT14679.1 hypothetical protein GRD61_08745 [Clavibacter michiganensis subsp. michiganensis]UQZ79363.1 hypothetical protein DQP53_08935 [Clavibacter michiganensis subsp. michiganensis]